MKKFTIMAIEGNLRNLILEKNMNLNDFSKYIGITYSALKAIYYGESKPSLESLIKIANKCDVSIDWLCTRNY